MSDDHPNEHGEPRAPAGCAQCRTAEPLPFNFAFAYQPIVELSTRSIYAHEALVRGPNGESAWSVLSQVNDDNRYAFDQACRVAAIKGGRRAEYAGLSVDQLPAERRLSARSLHPQHFRRR